MARVIGIGGVFFKSKDPKSLCKWYSDHLNLPLNPAFDGAVLQASNLPSGSYSVWSAFPDSTDYFKPSGKEYMINLIVDDVDEALEQAKSGGAKVIDQPQDIEFGRFGWFVDLEGNKIEVWKPSCKDQ